MDTEITVNTRTGAFSSMATERSVSTNVVLPMQGPTFLARCESLQC